mmetsp:Transcript_28459/g.39609  ORF Transcript_28459/g.39609 Transcript_28459/m.39609 type:complete len:1518 (-) Transcript_28459:138-4691(-)
MNALEHPSRSHILHCEEMSLRTLGSNHFGLGVLKERKKGKLLGGDCPISNLGCELRLLIRLSEGKKVTLGGGHYGVPVSSNLPKEHVEVISTGLHVEVNRIGPSPAYITTDTKHGSREPAHAETLAKGRIYKAFPGQTIWLSVNSTKQKLKYAYRVFSLQPNAPVPDTERNRKGPKKFIGYGYEGRCRTLKRKSPGKLYSKSGFKRNPTIKERNFRDLDRDLDAHTSSSEAKFIAEKTFPMEEEDPLKEELSDDLSGVSEPSGSDGASESLLKVRKHIIEEATGAEPHVKAQVIHRRNIEKELKLPRNDQFQKKQSSKVKKKDICYAHQAPEKIVRHGKPITRKISKVSALLMRRKAQEAKKASRNSRDTTEAHSRTLFKRNGQVRPLERRGRRPHSNSLNERPEETFRAVLNLHLPHTTVCDIIVEYFLIFSQISIYICPGGSLGQYRRRLLERRAVANGAKIWSSPWDVYERMLQNTFSRSIVIAAAVKSELELLNFLKKEARATWLRGQAKYDSMRTQLGRLEDFFRRQLKIIECHEIDWISESVKCQHRLARDVFPLEPLNSPNAKDGSTGRLVSQREDQDLFSTSNEDTGIRREIASASLHNPSAGMEVREMLGAEWGPGERKDYFEMGNRRDYQGNSVMQLMELPGSGDEEDSKANNSPEDPEISVAEHNARIAEMLMDMSKEYRGKSRFGGNDMRSSAFAKASAIVRGYPEKVISQQQANAIRGIGPKISKFISEFNSTGWVGRLKSLKANPRSKVLNLFQTIHDIGPGKAEELYKRGCRTLEDLKDHPLLKATSKLCLSLHSEITQKIPKGEAERYLRVTKQVIKTKLSRSLEAELCGSFCRGKPYCRDIDILCYDTSLAKGERRDEWLREILRTLKSEGLLTHILNGPNLEEKTKNPMPKPGKREVRHFESIPEKKVKRSRWTGKAQMFQGETFSQCAHALGMLPRDKGGPGIHRRIDIRICHVATLPFQKLHFQSGREFNRALRTHALNKGYTLSEHGLMQIEELTGAMAEYYGGKRRGYGEPIECKTEEEIFSILGLPYYPPSKRDVVPLEMSYLRTRGKRDKEVSKEKGKGASSIKGLEGRRRSVRRSARTTQERILQSHEEHSSSGRAQATLPSTHLKQSSQLSVHGHQISDHDSQPDPQSSSRSLKNVAAISKHVANSRKSLGPPLRYYVVMDIEATFEEMGRMAQTQEIIEISLALLNPNTYNIDHTMQVFVKPTEKPKLSLACMKFTGISQLQVDQAPHLYDALQQVDEWLRSHSLLPDSTGQKSNMAWKYPFALITDVGRDPVNFVATECRRKGIGMAHYFLRWVNLEYHFCDEMEVPSASLDDMLSHFKMRFEGNKHNGIDDARNLARVATKLMEIRKSKIRARGFHLPARTWPLSLNDGVGRGRHRPNSKAFKEAVNGNWEEVFMVLDNQGFFGLSRELLSRDRKDGWGIVHHAALSGNPFVISRILRYKGARECLESYTDLDVNGHPVSQTPFDIARAQGYDEKILASLFVHSISHD